MSYILPQVQVFQEFKHLPTAVSDNLNAFVFGPSYKLFRYSEESERALVGLGAYDSASDTAFDYPFQPDGSTVDTAYVKLYMEDVWAEYAAIPASGTAPLVCVSDVERNKLRAAPRVFCQANYKGHNTAGVKFNDDEVGGFYTGGVSLPENYYFIPVNSGKMDSDDVTLKYVTIEGIEGNVTVRATDNPLTAGSYIPLADGIVAKFSDSAATRKYADLSYVSTTKMADGESVTIGSETITLDSTAAGLTGVTLLNWIKKSYEEVILAGSEAAEYLEIIHNPDTDSGVLRVYKDGDDVALSITSTSTDKPTATASADYPGVVRAQEFKFVGNNGAVLSFGLTPKAAGYFADLDIDGDAAAQFHVIISNASSNALQATYDASSFSLTITCDSTNAAHTLGAIRDEVLNENTIGGMLSGSVLDPDQRDETLADIADSSGDLGSGYALYMQRDAYRVTVEPSDYVFKTGNGFDHSVNFKSRDVQVGDIIRYSVVDNEGTTLEGTTYVTDIEADDTASVLYPASVNSANATDNYGTVLTSGADIVVSGEENRRDMDGVDTKVYALSSTVQKYPGSYVNGVLSEKFTVTITTDGLAGVARATVDGTSGLHRENVLIEAKTGTDGVLYLGNNLYVQFDQGSNDADAAFQLGDTYTFASPITAPYNSIPSQDIEVSGSYRGPRDTTYVIEVVRGGVFTRDAAVIPGLSSQAGVTISVDLDWAAGDVDDEYILQCTAPGVISQAVFSATSAGGDVMTGIRFTDGAPKDIGSQGIELTMESNSAAFELGDYWVIKVFGARPQIKISDTAGVDQGAYINVLPQTTIDLGVYGGQISFDTNRNTMAGLAPNSNGGLVKGDVFYVKADAASKSVYGTLVLADDLPASVTTGREVGDMTDTSLANDWVSHYDPTEFSVWMYMVQDHAEIDSKKRFQPPYYNWEATEDGITIHSGIRVQDGSWVNSDGSQPYLPVYSGNMFVEYRALLSDYVSGIYSISDISDVVDTLGVVHPDNPLAQGVFNALLNSGDQRVFFAAVPSDDLDGFSAALDRATLVDTVYGFAPLTSDAQIQEAVEAHVDDMSGAENKRWRIAFVSKQIPTEKAVYDAATSLDGETEWLATVADNPSVPGDQYTVLTITNGTPALLQDVNPGDAVRLNFSTDAWGAPYYDEFVVERVLSNNSLMLKTGTANPIDIASKVEIWHYNSTAEIADAIKAQSERIADRRVFNIFPNTLFMDGVPQSGEFACAALAGLVSSVPPQQGLTNIEINGFDDLPLMYGTFSRDQLNTIASGGTLILMQDQLGGRVYVRHQISTALQDGNLLTAELSVTKNLDAVSYYFAHLLEPFYGRFNITPELLAVLKTHITHGLNYLGSDRVAAGLLGPMLILQYGNTKVRRIEQHPTLKDHVVIIVDLEMPLPMNVTQLRLVAGGGDEQIKPISA